MPTSTNPSLPRKIGACASFGLSTLLNRQASMDGVPFDFGAGLPGVARGFAVAHYGVMVPDLPEPFRFFNAIVALGDASSVPIYSNAHSIKTTKDDAAFVLTGTGALEEGFRSYSIAEDCNLTADDRHLQFADQLTLTRDGDQVMLKAALGDFSADMRLHLTPAVAHFARMPGIYDHIAVLAAYEGTFTSGSHSAEVTGLCTYEWARARNAPLPLRFFTYQIVNVTESTQVLMVEVLGIGGIVVQRMVYVRGTDGTASRHTRGYQHIVHTYADEPRITPDGHAMRMPKTFTWSVQDDDGSTLVEINGTTNEDYRYGLGSGFAGSFQYTGTFRGEKIVGTAYKEWIDRR